MMQLTDIAWMPSSSKLVTLDDLVEEKYSHRIQKWCCILQEWKYSSLLLRILRSPVPFLRVPIASSKNHKSLEAT